MEECLICFEEKKEEQFIFFPCQHKICNDCFPMFIMYSALCPLCNTSIIVPEITPQIQIQIQRQRHSVKFEMCKLWCGVIMIVGGIYYLVQLK